MRAPLLAIFQQTPPAGKKRALSPGIGASYAENSVRESATWKGHKNCVGFKPFRSSQIKAKRWIGSPKPETAAILQPFPLPDPEHQFELGEAFVV
jgi:hypothetical protein